MRRMPTVLAAAVSMVLLVCGVAAADTVTTDFESFTLGSVNGQDGWTSAVPGDIPALIHGYDQAVVQNSGAPPAFGAKSLRISNAYNEPTAEFEFQTYSTRTAQAAGEDLPLKEYTAQFSFISTKPNEQQPGLFMSVSPDNGHGGRMSYVGLRDTPEGIRVTVFDTPEPDGNFVGFDAGLLDRSVPHTIKFSMKLNPGPDNDLVRIAIDGVDLGQCFTTWENFYRTVPEPVPVSNSLLFLSRGQSPENPSLVGGGYLFDNVTVTTANGLFAPEGCDLVVDKTADQRTVTAGGNVGYRITVRNRGHVTARRIRVCDRIPRRMTFVSADRKLLRQGRLRCLLIPRLLPGRRVSFHLVLHVDPNAPQGRMDNTADITPPPAPPPPVTPPVTPPDPPKPPVKPRPVAKAKAVVRVVKRVKLKPPRFTG